MREYKLTEEMRNVLNPILQETRTKNEKRVTPLVYCAMAPLADLCVAAEDANREPAMHVESCCLRYKAVQNDETANNLADAVLNGMLADGVFLIPVEESTDGLRWGMLGKGADEVWMPLFTSMEKAQYWLDDNKFQAIPMSDAIMRAAGLQPVTGIVINPLADDILIYAELVHCLSSFFLDEYHAH